MFSNLSLCLGLKKKSISLFTLKTNNLIELKPFPTTSCNVCAAHGCHFMFEVISPISFIAFFIFALLSVVIICTFSLKPHSSKITNKASDIFCAVCGYLIYSMVRMTSWIVKFLSKKKKVTPKNPCLFLPIHISVVKLTEIALSSTNFWIKGKVWI